jgi:hypothetical protein
VGASRIRGVLLNLGIEIAESTVAKYMVKAPETWSDLDDLLRNHAAGTRTCLSYPRIYFQ